MSNEKYIGITLGPIYKTLSKADKTREIWGGSYLFSFLCRRLTEAILDIPGVDTKDFLLPSTKVIEKERLNKRNGINSSSKPGVGIYPDRILIKSAPERFDNVVGEIRKVKRSLVSSIMQSISEYAAYDPYARLFGEEVATSTRSKTPEEFLFDYFQVYSLEVDGTELHLLDHEGKDIGKVKSLNCYLDHLELRSSIVGFDPDPIKVFLRAINWSFLLRVDAFVGFDHFPSLPEISTTEIRFIKRDEQFVFRNAYDKLTSSSVQKAIDEEKAQTELERLIDTPEERAEENLLHDLFNIQDLFDDLRTYHKYVAIVHSDADRMGSLIGKLQTDEEVAAFSLDLITFAQLANKLIAGQRFTDGSKDKWGYGGAPIYIGGDDLVFFAPVATRVEKDDGSQEFQTVFHLIKLLDDLFDSVFNAPGKYSSLKGNRPCISYGVSITYIKHPLKEAFELSRKLMEDVKNDEYPSRNRIHFRINKHSGSFFGGIIDKNSEFPAISSKSVDILGAMLGLLDANNASSLVGAESEKFVNSISQKILQYDSVLRASITKFHGAAFGDAIQSLFDNVFNEAIHDTFRDYVNEIAALTTLILENYASQSPVDVRINEGITLVHGVLRFIHFIRDNEFRN